MYNIKRFSITAIHNYKSNQDSIKKQTLNMKKRTDSEIEEQEKKFSFKNGKNLSKALLLFKKLFLKGKVVVNFYENSRISRGGRKKHRKFNFY